MSFIWSIYDHLVEVFGPEITGITIVVVIALAFFHLMGAGRPST
jgi:hypothetical protein